MRTARAILVVALAMTGCAPPGYVYDFGSFTPRPENECLRIEAQQWMVLLLNKKVGQPEGPPAQVVSVSSLTELADEEAPAGTRVICHGRLDTTAGPAGPGIIQLKVAYSAETKTIFGSDASWETDASLRQKAAARTPPQPVPPTSDPATVQFCEEAIFRGRPIDPRSFAAMNAFRRCLAERPRPVVTNTAARDPALAAWEALPEKPELVEPCSTTLRYATAITDLRKRGASLNDLLRWAEQESERSTADLPTLPSFPIGTSIMIMELIRASYLGSTVYDQVAGGFPQFAYRACLKGRPLH